MRVTSANISSPGVLLLCSGKNGYCAT